jgi:hypothetical protein
MADVAKNTPPNTSKTIPTVPSTVPVKYSAAKMAATIILRILSVLPMFFFMQSVLGLLIQQNNQLKLE